MTKMRKKHETKNRGGNGINLIRKFDNDLNNKKTNFNSNSLQAGRYLIEEKNLIFEIFR